jgi:hypothetical protein
MIRALFDRQSQVSYRRLLAFAVGTGLLMGGWLTSGDWLWLALAYVGVEGAQRIAEAVAGGAKKAEPEPRSLIHG